MVILIVLVFFIQFFSSWIFKPLTELITITLEIHSLPFLLLILFIYLFIRNGKDYNAG